MSKIPSHSTGISALTAFARLITTSSILREDFPSFTVRSILASCAHCRCYSQKTEKQCIPYLLAAKLILLSGSLSCPAEVDTTFSPIPRNKILRLFASRSSKLQAKIRSHTSTTSHGRRPESAGSSTGRQGQPNLKSHPRRGLENLEEGRGNGQSKIKLSKASQHTITQKVNSALNIVLYTYHIYTFVRNVLSFRFNSHLRNLSHCVSIRVKRVIHWP